MNSNENNIDFNSRVKRLYLTDIVKHNLLNRTDIRTIRKWCKEYAVTILKDISGEYLIQQEFDLAYNAPVIANLKKKHGKEWQTVYPYYINNDLYKLVDIQSKATTNTARYIPKGV